MAPGSDPQGMEDPKGTNTGGQGPSGPLAGGAGQGRPPWGQGRPEARPAGDRVENGSGADP